MPAFRRTSLHYLDRTKPGAQPVSTTHPLPVPHHSGWVLVRNSDEPACGRADFGIDSVRSPTDDGTGTLKAGAHVDVTIDGPGYRNGLARKDTAILFLGLPPASRNVLGKIYAFAI